MRRLNIVDGNFVEFPFDESKPFIEVDEQQYNKIVNGDLIWKDGELIVNPHIIEQIDALKINLANTDYKAIKYAEGLISEQDYAEIKEQRQEWRRQINELEEEL